MTISDIFLHIPKVSKAFTDYVDNVALLRSRYLFISKAAGIQFAFCTHCKKQYTPSFLLGPLKHNEERECEKCGSLCKVKDSWRGRSKLIDEAYIVWYEKSARNPKSVVAQGIHVLRDYTGDFKNVESKMYIPFIYLFEPGDPRSKGKDRFGKSRMLRKTYYGQFVGTRTVYTERNQYAKRLRAYVSEANIKSAVEGTQLQYSQWQEFLEFRESDSEEWHGFNVFKRYSGETYTDMVEFFDLATRYPCVEYLVKMGLKGFVKAKQHGTPTYRSINWRGATMEKVLRLSRDEARELRTALRTIDDFSPLSMHSYRFHKDVGVPLSFEQAHLLRDLTFDQSISTVKELPVPYVKVVNYTLKQMRRKNSRYKRAHDVVIAWRDYLADCRKLDMSLSTEAILFPNDLYKAHQKTLTKVKYKEDKTLNGLIRKRLDGLTKKYSFNANGFLIRPAIDTIELFSEGRELSHCVGSYSKRYAEGICDLLVIRRMENPGKPFYTMEIRGNKVIQCYGFENEIMTPEVKAFVDQFIAKKLLTKKRTRIDVTGIQPVRQEVAI